MQLPVADCTKVRNACRIPGVQTINTTECVCDSKLLVSPAVSQQLRQFDVKVIDAQGLQVGISLSIHVQCVYYPVLAVLRCVSRCTIECTEGVT